MRVLYEKDIVYSTILFFHILYHPSHDTQFHPRVPLRVPRRLYMVPPKNLLSLLSKK